AEERPRRGREDALDRLVSPPKLKDFGVFQRWPYDWDFRVGPRGAFCALFRYWAPAGWARRAQPIRSTR
ncbi:MAG: hypothetical protein AAGM38_18810, partial [Pseudomonadota bacterium]